MWVPFHQGVISQFEGYDDLAELDWDTYRAEYVGIRRPDRILEAEGGAVDRCKASKQADVLAVPPAKASTSARWPGPWVWSSAA